MTRFLQIICALILACSVSACGFKGRLKSPTQIEKEEAKKAKKQQPETDAVPPVQDQPAPPIIVSPVEPQAVMPQPADVLELNSAPPVPQAAPQAVPAQFAPVAAPRLSPLSNTGNDIIIDTTPLGAGVPEQK